MIYKEHQPFHNRLFLLLSSIFTCYCFSSWDAKLDQTVESQNDEKYRRHVSIDSMITKTHPVIAALAALYIKTIARCDIFISVDLR